MQKNKNWLLAAALSTPLLTQAAEPASCDVVRLADVGWTDLVVTNAVTRVLLSDLGYRTKTMQLSVPETYQALRYNNVDVFLDTWMPSSEEGIRPYLDDGSVELLAVNLEGAKYTLAVNQAAYEGGLKDFADIAKFKDQLGGKIYGIEPGNSGNKSIQQMIGKNAFGLGDFKLVESSEDNMILHVKRAEHIKKWAVFLGWEPHPMNNQLSMHYLSGGDDYFGPNLGGATVYTSVRKGYSEECPNIGRLLKNLRFSLQMENDLMEALLNQNTNPRREAKAWLKANPQIRAQWLQGVTRRDGSVADMPSSDGKKP
ncbi:glycine/betaine ABC transporter substrate-binding protein [Pseudomonas taeanensis MS-3]|uniref:Glycine/betaine ABC transporter substrate-binding protein n=1 Tax=Pseudomonas taeanensis MS-3 TaxID=1395571 RepID=A0A0A1YNJ7_9PSED|nr:choline ABC transporter substrate-binding protein [Pseudomonas taeanensis]KFX70528.1 glycine/betaine ABC transporter substrate-binding protein [Pseudomonas taeanensis MS-3]